MYPLLEAFGLKNMMIESPPASSVLLEFYEIDREDRVRLIFKPDPQSEEYQPLLTDTGDMDLIEFQTYIRDQLDMWMTDAGQTHVEEWCETDYTKVENYDSVFGWELFRRL